MAIPLKQSTASQEIPLGYFLDSTDGNTEETGLTIANTDIKLWKSGATTLANKNSGGATHISNGIYYAVLDDTDTNTVGPLVVFVHVAGALAVRVECVVYVANVYDSIIAGSDKLYVDVSEISSDSTAANNAESFFDGTGYAGTNNVIPTVTAVTNGVTLANDAITAAKYDESTAFPLTSADTGATQIARTGADGDTLETLSDEIAVVDGNVDSILADTGTDGVIVASGSIDDIVTAINAATVDGTITKVEADKIVLAHAAGDIALSEGTYTIKDQSGSSLYTFTVSSTERDVTIT